MSRNVIARPNLDFKKPTAAPVGTESAIWAEDPRNPYTYALKITADINIPIVNLLGSAPTDALYLIRDVIDKILSEREDARK